MTDTDIQINLLIIFFLFRINFSTLLLLYINIWFFFINMTHTLIFFGRYVQLGVMICRKLEA